MPKLYKFILGYLFACFALMLLLNSVLTSVAPHVSYTTFKRYVHEDQVEQVEISDTLIRGTLKPEMAKEGTSKRFTTVVVADPDLVKELEARGVDVRGRYESLFMKTLLSWILPGLVVVAIWAFVYRHMGAGGGVMAFGKSRARIYANKAIGVTFADVAGQDEAKEELQEIIEFLQHPQKFRLLGGKLPRGVLLVGPPGTGKTLLAQAVAGEAGVPFFSISGTEFVELFVGVGAARVRDLFKQGRPKRRALCLSMSSMPWAKRAAWEGCLAVMTNGNRR